MAPTAAAPSHDVPRGLGFYLAALQLFFALSWVVYVVYLPQLAQQAGLPLAWVPWLLVADQLVFIATDLAVGLASDRAARVLGRIGRWVVAASVLSALAFVLLPWVAPRGSPWLFGGVTLLWVATTSALRAPPLALLGRYVAKPAQPAMVALWALGLGVASALAPFIALHLKGLAPQLPFALSAASVALVSLGMVAAERALARQAPAAPAPGTATPPAPAGPGAVRLFLLASLLGAAAFQWHHAISSGPLWLRVAAASDLPWLLPVFWIGFNLCLWPAGVLARRLGAPAAMAFGAELAMLGTAGAALAPTAALLGAAQIAAGAGWALLLCAAFAGALALGAGGREGRLAGALSATLALAALARIAWVASAAPPPAAATQMAWWPAVVFALAAGLLVLRALRS